MKMRAGNAIGLKELNRKAILRLLYQKPLSRAGISRELKLTKTSVSDHIDELINDGVVCEIGAESAERGRKPVLLDINPRYGFFAGLYLSRSVGRLGIVDMKGQIASLKDIGNIAGAGPEEMITRVSRVLPDMLKAADIAQNMLIGMGVGVPGPVDNGAQMILTPPGLSAWHNYPLAGKLSDTLALPVYLENNAAALTLKEYWFGYGRVYKYFILMVVDSGIGGGIVAEGRRITGVSGYGSEFGHTSIECEGRLCPCGGRGCLEQYAAVPVLLRDCFSPEEKITTWKQLANGAESGDVRCKSAIEREAGYLSAALVNFVNVLEPEAVILSGDIAYKPEYLLRALSEKISSSAIMRAYRTVDIKCSPACGEEEALAAATVALEAYL